MWRRVSASERETVEMNSDLKAAAASLFSLGV